MREQEMVIRNPTGLHARPAKTLAKLAKQFAADIRITHGEKNANAKSLISLLTLGVESGNSIRIIADGADEDEALKALVQAVELGLGEEDLLEKTSAEIELQPVADHETRHLVADGATTEIRGIPAAPGIAIGPIFRYQPETLVIDETSCGEPAEKARLSEALATAGSQLQRLYSEMSASTSPDEAAIFEVQLELLEDKGLLGEVVEGIESGFSAAAAWQGVIDEQSRVMLTLNDPLLAARAADLRDVGNRVLRSLLGLGENENGLPDRPFILVADDLSPSDTASLDRQKILGFCTAAGGPTAHSAIIARALGLPAVVSAGASILELDSSTVVILNGSVGTLTIDPDASAIAAAQKAQQTWQAELHRAANRASEPAVTFDGHRVEVVANIGGLADAENAIAAGAEGVGLLRTEFLFLNRNTPPTEEEQFVVYQAIIKALNHQAVIVRTLDIGGDKQMPYIDVPPETNPFLGERGIRLLLNRPELLRQQLRAILRAAAHGPTRIMFPMVADVTEWRAAKAIVEEVRRELDAPEVELGIMIEIPAAAMMADAFASEVDFFSVGTNDLTQYALAVDRMHPSLAKLSDGLHPAVLRLIARTVDAAHSAGKWVGVCGELGADPQAIPILVGMGVDELSVGIPAIASVKAQIRSMRLSEAKELAQRALTCTTASEVRALW